MAHGTHDHGVGATARVRAIVGLEVFELVGALVGTVGLLHDGYEFMGRTVATRELPLRSWTLAGVSLLVANGMVPAIALALAWRRDRRARAAHLLTGAVLMAWIVGQAAVIGLVFVLQPVMFLVGAAITTLAAVLPANLPGRDNGRRGTDTPTAVGS